MQDNVQENRIPTHTAGFMLAVAAFYDALQVFFNLILIGFIINWSVSLVSFLTFYVWFRLHGVSIGDTVKKIALWVGDYLLDIFSGGIFPSIFISTLVTILIVKSEDALRNKGVDISLTVTDSYRQKVARERAQRQETQEAAEEEAALAEEQGEGEEDMNMKRGESAPPIAAAPRNFSETLSRVASLKNTAPKQGALTGRVAPPPPTKSEVIPNQVVNPQNNRGILGRIERP